MFQIQKIGNCYFIARKNTRTVIDTKRKSNGEKMKMEIHSNMKHPNTTRIKVSSL